VESFVKGFDGFVQKGCEAKREILGFPVTNVGQLFQFVEKTTHEEVNGKGLSSNCLSHHFRILYSNQEARIQNFPKVDWVETETSVEFEDASNYAVRMEGENNMGL